MSGDEMNKATMFGLAIGVGAVVLCWIVLAILDHRQDQRNKQRLQQWAEEEERRGRR
jgi:hypothetical protein